jgi:hypothetical protein
MLAGVRSPAAAPVVDVKLAVTEAKERMSIAGQVLTPGSNMRSKFPGNAPVGLESGGVMRYQTHTNEIGEFRFEVPKDTYRLWIELPEGQITILDVQPR